MIHSDRRAWPACVCEVRASAKVTRSRNIPGEGHPPSRREGIRMGCGKRLLSWNCSSIIHQQSAISFEPLNMKIGACRWGFGLREKR